MEFGDGLDRCAGCRLSLDGGEAELECGKGIVIPARCVVFLSSA